MFHPKVIARTRFCPAVLSEDLLFRGLDHYSIVI